MLLAPSMAFTFAYVLAIWYCYTHMYRDPTSIFFKPDLAYEPVYTKTRLREAASYIEKLSFFSDRRQNNINAPFVCVGIPTVARTEVGYFPECVGALFQGLHSAERQDIHFIPFFAESDPEKHPAYHETWLNNVADSVLTYNQMDIDLQVVQELEADTMHREKGLLDYRLLLEKCASTGAEYVAMIEDDVIAAHDWFPRMQQALMEAEHKTHLRGFTNFFYLRLFFTEEFFGWNSEYWQYYLGFSVLFVLCTGLLCISARASFVPCKRIMTTRLVIIICGIYAPLSIGLFFAAGRMSMIGLNRGVTEMNDFGCCSQSLVFPQAQIPELLEWYRLKKIGYVDSLTEELADNTGGLRWALIPSSMQHIGRKSTKPADNAAKAKHKLTPAELIWNFGFELYEPVR